MSLEASGLHDNQKGYDQAPSVVPESSSGPAAFSLVPVDSRYHGNAQTTVPSQVLQPQADLNRSTPCPTPFEKSAPSECRSPPSSKIPSDSHVEHLVPSESGPNTADTSGAQETDKPDSIPENSSEAWPPHRGYRGRHKRKRDDIESDAIERRPSPAAPQAPSDLEHQNQDLRRKLHMASRYIQNLKEQTSALDAHYRTARHALETEQALRQDDRRLLDIRAQELQSAQAFLSKADVYSCAEVLHLVQSLNNELFQTAALITDSVLAKEDASPSTTLAGKLHGCYDDRILALLRSEDKDVQACVLQEVIQSVFANVAAESINSWDMDPVRHEMLLYLYKGMQTTNPAVSGRWRALTRAQNKYGFSENPEVLHARTIISKVIRILRFSGRRMDKEEFKLTFGKNVLDFTTLLTKVDRAMGEGITSQDLSVYLPSPGSAFDANTMIDENAENVETGLEVALSTKLGLRGTTIIADSNAPAEVILGKASVLLYATLAEVQN
ncbi:hypothetical protein BDZ89DRAFT_1068048 [Hymenopellis radicata]|nr:hypothetical protein BDZ89DRAFT_1068048 [Hymenopellis radicata]